MPRPKKYENPAMRQKAYRLRKLRDDADNERLYRWRLEKLHASVQRAAADGNVTAQTLLGRNPYDTALRMIMYSQPESGDDSDYFTAFDMGGFNQAFYAYEQAHADIQLKQAGQRQGVFKVTGR